ncbi:MAG: hypothetical protein HRU75_13640 [Planctomycetia bacterium]|nr:MAG: hypothetical protein HRU75_13640 [Planctomycetia bacterium]
MPLFVGFVQPEISAAAPRAARAGCADRSGDAAPRGCALRVVVRTADGAALIREIEDESQAAVEAGGLLAELDADPCTVDVRLERALRDRGPRFDPSRMIAGERGGWTDVWWERVEAWSFEPSPDAAAHAVPHREPPDEITPRPSATPARSPSLSLDPALPTERMLPPRNDPPPVPSAGVRPTGKPPAPPAFRGYGWQAAVGVAALLGTWFVAWALLVR